MKKFISTIAFVFGVFALSFAQTATNTAITEGSEELAKSKVSGSYVYTLPQGTTSDEVSKAASYYKQYFTVNYEQTSQEASIEIVGDAAPSRQIILRFLSGCGVRYIEVDGESKALDVFYEDNLK